MVFGTVLLLILLVISACSGSDGSSRGVAQIEGAQVADNRSETESDVNRAGRGVAQIERSRVPDDRSETEGDVSRDELTDEEITTRFVECMRDLGFNLPDPELNSDGTVDTITLRQNIANYPKFDPSSGRSEIQKCLPVLQGATFARQPSPEDVIELQDNLLEFAQCLRDQGVDIPDPDFSNGPRAAMGSMFQGLNRARLQEEMRSCGNAFGGRRRPTR